MHELSLCRSLLRIIENEMAELNGSVTKRVTAIWLEVSALCSVDIKIMEFYFALVAENTLAENARLHIAIIPTQARCIACQQDVNIADFAPCPLCGNYTLIMESKPELLVKSMEVS